MTLALLMYPYWIQANEINSSFAIGVVTHNDSRLLMTTTEDSLQDEIVIMCSPMNEKCKPVRNDFSPAPEKNESVEDVAAGKQIYSYSTLDDVFWGGINIAIIYPKAKIGKINVTPGGENHILISDNSFEYNIFLCTSREGVHIYSDYKKIHLYYALGYEVIASCSKEVYE